jgi:glycosyltransferase involved in cell wall biosynthesis
MAPRVSVILTAYNAAPHVSGAIHSLLRQTFTDLEIVVVDDYSTDNTHRLVAGIDDPRLVILHHEVNEGPFVAANRGLEVARGSFIARLDADDRARPERLARELAWLDAHPDVGIIGTAYEVIDETGRPQGVRRMPTTDLEIRWQSLLLSPFLHSSVMIRRDLLRKHHLVYDPDLRMGGDYELWSRLLPHTHARNLEEPLTEFRIWSGSISSTARPAQRAIHDEVAFRTVSTELPDLQLGQEEVAALRQLVLGEAAIRPKVERRLLAQSYCSLFAAFASRHAGAVDLPDLSTRVAALAEEWAR